MTVSQGALQFEVFYDGDCPLCLREIRMLQRLDRAHAVRFTNIADSAFDPARLGLTWEAMMKRIYGRMPSGELVHGPEVFRQLYGAVGFRRAVWFSRLPVVSALLELAYTVFAKNRLRLTGRCTDTCELPRRNASPDHERSPRSAVA